MNASPKQRPGSQVMQAYVYRPDAGFEGISLTFS